MAKKFNIIFKRVKESVYSSEQQALTVLAAANSVVALDPILAPNGKVDGTTPKFTVQRKKRPTVNTVAKAQTGATADALAALDQFSKVEWESLEIATGVLRSVGVKATINDSFDADNNNLHDNDAMYMMGEVAEQRKADLLALMETFTASGAALPAYAKGDTLVWDAIADEVITLAQKTDEFKAKTSRQDYVIVVSPKVAKELAKEYGTVFNQEAPIANTGFTSRNSINGTPVIVEESLAGREVYVFHKDALAFKSEMIEKEIAIDLGLTEYTGVFFYDVQAVIDSARAVKFGA